MSISANATLGLRPAREASVVESSVWPRLSSMPLAARMGTCPGAWNSLLNFLLAPSTSPSRYMAVTL
ncbi:hypothetical protein D1872_320670 [compost metagenome]